MGPKSYGVDIPSFNSDSFPLKHHRMGLWTPKNWAKPLAFLIWKTLKIARPGEVTPQRTSVKGPRTQTWRKAWKPNDWPFWTMSKLPNSLFHYIIPCAMVGSLIDSWQIASSLDTTIRNTNSSSTKYREVEEKMMKLKALKAAFILAYNLAYLSWRNAFKGPTTLVEKQLTTFFANHA